MPLGVSIIELEEGIVSKAKTVNLLKSRYTVYLFRINPYSAPNSIAVRVYVYAG